MSIIGWCMMQPLAWYLCVSIALAFLVIDVIAKIGECSHGLPKGFYRSDDGSGKVGED